jgi:hypothetical protein
MERCRFAARSESNAAQQTEVTRQEGEPVNTNGVAPPTSFPDGSRWSPDHLTVPFEVPWSSTR